MKENNLFIIGLIIIILLIPTNINSMDMSENKTFDSEKAKVINIEEMEEGDEYSLEGLVEKITIEILTGELKGEIIETENIISDIEAYNMRFEIGDKILISIEEDLSTGEKEILITDHYRVNNLIFLVIVFIALVLFIGKVQGLRAIISLGLTVIAIVYLLLPGILKGYNPIFLSIIISISITIITILLITGFSIKSLSAIIGTSLGVLVAGLVAYIMGSKTYLTGLSAEDATMLMFIPQEIDFNFQHLLFAGIILGALGAVMDVGMSIASSIDEIYEANSELNRKELFNSGMNVGKDIMGTMVNTLILAYAGTSIPMLLLFMAYDTTIIDILNLDMIGTEIVRSISGSIGLILTIPATALISSFLIKNKEDIKNDGEENHKRAYEDDWLK